jgi:threonine dehydratase
LHGVATIGLELHEDDPNLDMIFVPIGGGGLAAGLGTVYESLRGAGKPRIVGVQPSGSRPIYEFFHHGRILSEPQPTVAACLAGEPESGAIILDIGRRVLSDIIVVTDAEIRDATARLASRGVFVESGAAAGYAAYLRSAGTGGRTGVILTGAK